MPYERSQLRRRLFAMPFRAFRAYIIDACRATIIIIDMLYADTTLRRCLHC